MWVAGGTGTQVDGTASAKAQRQVHTHLFRDSKGPMRLRWSELGASGKPGSQRAGAGSGRASQASERTVAFGLR